MINTDVDYSPLTACFIMFYSLHKKGHGVSGCVYCLPMVCTLRNFIDIELLALGQNGKCLIKTIKIPLNTEWLEIA